MPLFFLLTGLFVHGSASASSWLGSKTDALLKPYAVTLLIYSVLRLLAGRHDAGTYYLGMLKGNGVGLPESFIPLWFLPHLWVVMVFAWALMRLVHLPQWPAAGQLLVLMLMLLPGIALMGQAPVLPWGLDLALISGAFVITGVLLKAPLFALGQLGTRRLWLLAAAGALILGGMHLLGPSSVDLNMRRWDDPLRSTLAAGGGIIATLAIAGLLARPAGDFRRSTAPWLAWPAHLLATLGRASLLILLFHYIIQAYSWKALDTLWPDHPWLTALAAYGCGLWLPVWLGRGLIQRHRWLAAVWLPLRTMPTHRPSGDSR